MNCWAIGDVQGCAEQLSALLQRIQFNPDHDQLWFCGDLVNRGPRSLATLRLLYERRDNLKIVLGNHDLHLLAVAFACRDARKNDTFDDVLAAPDREKLVQWLLEQPLAVWDQKRQVLMTHAGLPPTWGAAAALEFSNETMRALRDNPSAFFSHMYGNEPARWSNDLNGAARYRYTINALTRMRFVDAHGALDLKHKGRVDDSPATLTPWFAYRAPRETQARVVFGHWAALQGHTGDPRFVALDTGCVWGGKLSAYHLDDGYTLTVAGWQAGATLAAED